MPTKPIADRAFRLQSDCSARVGHVMPGTQEKARREDRRGTHAAPAGQAYPEGRYATVTTTCPFLCPFSTYVWASTISSSG